MWAWLPDALTELLAGLAPPEALPTLALLERRCYRATVARLASLGRLRAPPFCQNEAFPAGGRLLLGRQGGRLNLFKRGIGAEEMTIFASGLRSGALPRLELLGLRDNQIGDDGLKAFSTALGSEALPRLERLYLHANQIGDDGMKALSTALGNGALMRLQKLYLGGNQIGDGGMQSFAAALSGGSGALPNLTHFYLSGNPGNAAPAEKALEDRKKA